MSTREEPLSDQRRSIDKQTMGDTTGSQLHIYMYQVLSPAGSTKYWRLLPPEHVQTSYHHVPGTSPKHTTKDVNNSHRAARSISATIVALLAHIPRQAPNSRAASPYLGIRIYMRTHPQWRQQEMWTMSPAENPPLDQR